MGKAVVETLATDLQNEFPGVSGFSVQNLWYMRKFYREYNGDEKLQPLVGEIGWSHNLIIMDKCKDKLAVRDEYNFSFLEIADEHAEKELETAIMKNMRRFLQEMGGDFTL